LTLRSQHGLRPSPAGAQHANLRADNVARFLGGLGHVVWISTLDLTRISQSKRVVFRTMSAYLRRPLQRPGDNPPGILPQSRVLESRNMLQAGQVFRRRSFSTAGFSFRRLRCPRSGHSARRLIQSLVASILPVRRRPNPGLKQRLARR
jgi:hypothetical protein